MPAIALPEAWIRRRGAFMLTCGLAAAWLAGMHTAASAQTHVVEKFYRGNSISLVVGSGPGGSHDLYARLLARHLGRHVPGNPSVVVQNTPGAGGLRAANYLYNFASRDGTAIGMFARTVPLLGLLGGSNVQFDPRKFIWLGSPASFQNDANILLVRKDAPVKTIEEARRPDLPPLMLGGSAEGGIGNDVPIILHDTIGLHVKQVVGYPDSPAIFVAMERGEVHGRTVDLSTVKSVKPDWLKPDGGFRVLGLSRAGAIRTCDPASGVAGRANRARARKERGGACADRAR
ncbi:MAG: hypothetical protein E6G96_09230 [Alphaproteobacteria bacterium]|nr:MAG: hypothetical protein E6G96_09230 [Alphaproteobacteria bacterium]